MNCYFHPDIEAVSEKEFEDPSGTLHLCEECLEAYQKLQTESGSVPTPLDLRRILPKKTKEKPVIEKEETSFTPQPELKPKGRLFAKLKGLKELLKLKNLFRFAILAVLIFIAFQLTKLNTNLETPTIVSTGSSYSNDLQNIENAIGDVNDNLTIINGNLKTIDSSIIDIGIRMP